jgi:hypothetical protein
VKPRSAGVALSGGKLRHFFPPQGTGEAPTISALKHHPSVFRRRVWRRGCRASSTITRPAQRRSRPQSRRCSADLLTINWPDAPIGKSLATKKQKKAKQPGLVSVTEKTKRISGLPRGHVGPHGKRDADIDRRSHHRRGDLAVRADHGCRYEVRGHRDS